VLVGAGDSYCAAVCSSLLAGPRVAALDPFSLAQSPEWARRRPVYIISISGATSSNLELAHALKGMASTRVAITCDPGSPLAKEVDEVIRLPFKPLPKSPGIATFALSLAASLKMCGLDPDCDFHSALANGKKESRRVRISRGGVTHFTGNNEAYAISIYASAKVYELLGGKSQATLLEEFSHMPLFSLEQSDTVNVLGETGKGERLATKLKQSFFRASVIRGRGTTVERLYGIVFACQMGALREAKERGLARPRFLDDEEKLKISDEMIY